MFEIPTICGSIGDGLSLALPYWDFGSCLSGKTECGRQLADVNLQTPITGTHYWRDIFEWSMFKFYMGILAIHILVEILVRMRAYRDMFTLSLPSAWRVPTGPHGTILGECTSHQLFGLDLHLLNAQMSIEVVFRMLGPNYEIISAFIQNSDELGLQAVGFSAEGPTESKSPSVSVKRR